MSTITVMQSQKYSAQTISSFITGYQKKLRTWKRIFQEALNLELVKHK